MTRALPREQVPKVSGRVAVQAGRQEYWEQGYFWEQRPSSPGPGQMLLPHLGNPAPSHAGQLPTQPDASRDGFQPGRKAQGSVHSLLLVLITLVLLEGVLYSVGSPLRTETSGSARREPGG